jgi:hypothetical protein
LGRDWFGPFGENRIWIPKRPWLAPDRKEIGVSGFDRGRVKTPWLPNLLILHYDSPAANAGDSMTRFVAGADRTQDALFPGRLDDYVAEDNPSRVIDIFVDQLDLAGLGFGGVEPKKTGRPGYHPATMLKLYIYGYLNRVQSSRRLEKECQRNVEVMWLWSMACSPRR